jgi:two-component system, cell cycle sensor histidine kinase and response regulator CckA
MPEMTGSELSVKMNAIFPDIKNLFMSGYTSNVIVHQGVLEEGVHFIQKPFTLKDLAIKVRQAIESNK